MARAFTIEIEDSRAEEMIYLCLDMMLVFNYAMYVPTLIDPPPLEEDPYTGGTQYEPND